MRYRAAALSIFILVSWLAFVHTGAGSTEPAQQQRRARGAGRQRTTPRTAPAPRANYSNFSHATKAHRQECASCHKFPSANWKEARKGDAAIPDVTEYPQHSSCLKCHNQQFFARERPAPRICSVCHVGVTPRYTERHPFPNPPEVFSASKRALAFVSDFRINFSHDKHVELVGVYGADSAGPTLSSHARPRAAQEGDKSCSFCHQTYQPQGKSADEFVTPRPKDLPDEAFWLKKGTFKTTPNHATCFTCHTPEADVKPASSDCAMCHSLPPQGETGRYDFDSALASKMAITDGTIMIKWRKRDSSGTFTHEGGAHADLGCSTCHKTAGMNTLDLKSKKVSVLSCGGEGSGCHIEADGSGVLNMEVEQKKAKADFQCAKCHISFGKEPAPKSHLDAASAAGAK